ncbi:hypothetical protein BDC45DRAFT_496104 [Circinella umbellata]|nr:hypothetical protein BDC45DRAFT_496104 [Circinella umbellata]
MKLVIFFLHALNFTKINHRTLPLTRTSQVLCLTFCLFQVFCMGRKKRVRLIKSLLGYYQLVESLYSF